jgi:hypothetical protein
MADERLYGAQPERVFAALMHALAGLSARVERVEGFGTEVAFSAPGLGDGELRPFSAYVLHATDGAVVQVHPRDASGAGIPTRLELELIPGLLDAVQDRLDRGPQARS